MPALVGTSGWLYQHWRGSFYPPTLAQRRWLPFYAGRFATVELNNSFYRLPDKARFQNWAAGVPDAFIFSLKASRYLTHIRRLRDPAEPVARLLNRVEGLGKALGPILMQLPPNLKADLDLLCAAMDAFPHRFRLAVEFRDPSWNDEAVFSAMARREVAYCLADRRGRIEPWRRTASWGYVRFHEGRASPPTSYGRQALQSAAEELSDIYDPGDDLYIYFNNDTAAAAVDNAEAFAGIMRQRGWTVPQGPGEPQGS